MTTRSEVLARVNDTIGGYTTIGPPPHGFCWIVKTVHMTNVGNSVTVDLYVGTSLGGWSLPIFHQVIATNGLFVYSSWLMVMETDSMTLHTDVPGARLWMSGTVLPSPPAS